MKGERFWKFISFRIRFIILSNYSPSSRNLPSSAFEAAPLAIYQPSVLFCFQFLSLINKYMGVLLKAEVNPANPELRLI